MMSGLIGPWRGAGVVLAVLMVLTAVVRGQTLPAAGEIDLRPRFEKGQTIKYVMEMHSKTANATSPAKPVPRPRRPSEEPETEPRDQDTETKLSMGLTMNVLEVSPQGVAQVQMVFDSLKITAKTADAEVEFDSSKPLTDNADMVTAMLKPLVGSTITMSVDRAGNISQVSGGEAFTMLGQITSGSGGGSQPLFGPIFSGRPADGFAKVGESWEYEDKVSTSLLGGFKMVTRHTLRGMVGRDAQVLLNGRIEPESEAAGESPYKITSSSHSGSYTWDTATGQLAKMESKMKVCLEGRIAERPMATCTKSMDVKVTRIRGR